MGDRALRAVDLDLDCLPDRRRRPAAHGLRDRSDDPHVQRRHGAPAGRDIRADRGRCATATRACSSTCFRRRPRRSTRWSASTGRTSSIGASTTACSAARCARCSRCSSISRGLDAWITGLRRDQWATRSDIRKVEIDHDHGAIVKLNPLAEWSEDEVWDYVREHDLPVQLPLRQGLHVDRLRAVHATDADGRGPARGAVVVGDERAEGVRHPLRDRDGRARARVARSDRRRQ